MRVLWLVVLGVCTLHAHAAVMETITQTTTGWCSPAVGATGENVTIICQGVDPRALARLNEILDKKDVELQAKMRDAEAWAQKYRELAQRLATQEQDEPLAQQAQALLQEGNLEKAGELLDRLLAVEEQTVERAAAHHFNRAEVYALQWQPAKALPHYKQAYDYRPDNIEYAHRYAATLQAQGDFQSAEALYQTNLDTLRARSTVDPATSLPTLGRTLTNLGLLYNDTHRPDASEQACQEALQIQRQLAESNAPTHLAGLAAALNNLGILYYKTQRWRRSEDTYQELQIWRRLAETNSGAYVANVADTLVNLGVLYTDIRQWHESERAHQEALHIRRRLAESNPAYRRSVGASLLGLWNLYNDMCRSREAEEVYQEALRSQQPWAQNKAASLPCNVRFMWAFVALVTEGKVMKLVPIEEDMKLKTGDLLKMFVELRTPCFVYVIHHGARGEIQRLFPYDIQQFTTDYQTSKIYEIPPNDGWFRINEQARLETFYLVASAQRLMDLEQLLATYAAAQPAEQPLAATNILAELRNLLKQHRAPMKPGRPVPIAGNMRKGTEGVEITAPQLYIETFTIERE